MKRKIETIGGLLAIVLTIAMFFYPKRKEPHKPASQVNCWCAAIQVFDTVKRQEVVYYDTVLLKRDSVLAIFINGARITNDSFLADNEAADPWYSDITLKSGYHIKLELLNRGKCKKDSVLIKANL